MYDFSDNFCTNSKSTFRLPIPLSLSHSISFLPFQFIWWTWTRANIVLLFIFDARIARAVCECVHQCACMLVPVFYCATLLPISLFCVQSISLAVLSFALHLACSRYFPFQAVLLNTVRLNLVEEVALYNFLRCMVWGAQYKTMSE